MALFRDTGLSQIILQAGQMITESLAQANRLKFQRDEFEQQKKLYEENSKLRESKLKLTEEKLQLEQAVSKFKIQEAEANAKKATADANVAVASEKDRIAQETNQAASGVLSLEKANQDIEFENQMRPHKLALATADAELKSLELKAATQAGGDLDAIKKQLDLVNQRSLITGRILTTSEEAAKLHVKKPGTRNQILGGLGTDIAKKYGSREYGWFYNQREQIEQALAENQPGNRKRLLQGAGLPPDNPAVAAQELQDINRVIGAYEGEISKFMSETVDLTRVQADLRSMARNIAMQTGTSSQPTTTTLNSSGPQRSAPEVQLEKIATADPDTAAEEAFKLGQDISQKNGTGLGPALSNIIQSLPDDQRRAEITNRLKARLQTQGGRSMK